MPAVSASASSILIACIYRVLMLAESLNTFVEESILPQSPEEAEMMDVEFTVLVLSFLFPLFVCASNGLFAKNNVLWYMSLLQSKFAPSRVMIRVNWSLSYLFMSIGSFLIWQQEHTAYSVPYLLYSAQLVVNATYCPIFFGAKRLDLALLDILLLDAILLGCVVSFYSTSLWAGIFITPYFLWVLFNTALNADFHRLQEGKLKNPVYFTQNYSCHTLYQSTLERKTAKSKNAFYSTVPDAPTVLTPPLAPGETARYRLGATPEALYVN